MNGATCVLFWNKEEPKETIPKHLLKGAMNLPTIDMDHN